MSLPASMLLRRGVARRCPVCGQGSLFRHWVAMVPECPGCGLVFRRAPGQWLGSWFLNILVVQAVLVVAIPAVVVLTWPGTLVVPAILAIAVSVAVVVPLAVFPFTRTIWTAIDLIMRPLEFGEGVPPGVELEQVHSTGIPAATQSHRDRKGPDGGIPPSR